MLELPESHVLAAQLRRTLRGKQIAGAVANSSPHKFAFYHDDPALYGPFLTGRCVDDAAAYGGWVELELGDARLLFGDGANLRYLAPGTKPPAKHQLYLPFTDGSALVCTVQMYGSIYAYPAGTLDNAYYLVAREKPSPLTAAFDAGYFRQIWEAAKPTLSVKALLATEQRIPGLGNGVLQDILFRAGLHPKKKLDSLGPADRDRLFAVLKQTLGEMTDQGGRDTEKDLFGNPGGYVVRLSKNTLKHPCPVCGGTLARQAYLGGNVYFCPNCQPL